MQNYDQAAALMGPALQGTTMFWGIQRCEHYKMIVPAS